MDATDKGTGRSRTKRSAMGGGKSRDRRIEFPTLPRYLRGCCHAVRGMRETGLRFLSERVAHSDEATTPTKYPTPDGTQNRRATDAREDVDETRSTITVAVTAGTVTRTPLPADHPRLPRGSRSVLTAAGKPFRSLAVHVVSGPAHPTSPPSSDPRGPDPERDSGSEAQSERVACAERNPEAPTDTTADTPDVPTTDPLRGDDALSRPPETENAAERKPHTTDGRDRGSVPETPAVVGVGALDMVPPTARDAAVPPCPPPRIRKRERRPVVAFRPPHPAVAARRRRAKSDRPHHGPDAQRGDAREEGVRCAQRAAPSPSCREPHRRRTNARTAPRSLGTARPDHVIAGDRHPRACRRRSADDRIVPAPRWEAVKTVYRGKDTKILRARWCDRPNKAVAIKRGRSSCVTARRRLRCEYRLMRALDHPNIVRPIAFKDSPTRPELVMPWFRNGDVLELLLATGPLSPSEALRLWVPISHAVAHAHLRYVFHRDIKPENVFLDSKGRPYLGDWGLAAPWRFEGRESGTCGTAHYAAPELLAGRIYRGPEVDMYSLGALLFAMLTARLPPELDPKLPAHRLARQLDDAIVVLPASLRELVRGLMEPDPIRRWIMVDVRRFLSRVEPRITSSRPSRGSRIRTRFPSPADDDVDAERSPSKSAGGRQDEPENDAEADPETGLRREYEEEADYGNAGGRWRVGDGVEEKRGPSDRLGFERPDVLPSTGLCLQRSETPSRVLRRVPARRRIKSYTHPTELPDRRLRHGATPAEV